MMADSVDRSDQGVPAAAGRRLSNRRDWGQAVRALRRLMADKNDTGQVFEVMRTLNGNVSRYGYRRLLRTAEGGRIGYERVELACRFTDRAWLASFRPGSVGAAYRDFLDVTGYSADGLAEISLAGPSQIDRLHPHAWFARRLRDTHDIWHVLTGYKADEHLGEASLVAFSYAQTGGLGWGAIAVAIWLQTLRRGLINPQGAAIWEGYRLGRRAAWLQGLDYEALLAEPLEAARARLGIGAPVRYLQLTSAQRACGLGEHLKSVVAADAGMARA